METAIKKAIEGGWDKWWTKYHCEYFGTFVEVLYDGTHTEIYYAEILLDPLFWSCLGKALGWKDYMVKENPYSHVYLYYWHRFIDKLASGGTAEEFFRELLS
jgi:hypothetical protein